MVDAFKQARRDADTLTVAFGDESIPMLLTYRGVRAAAKDWQTFSSDAPFRVPIPSEEAERSVRQLPIETDPPVHQKYRALVEPFFRRPTQADYVTRIEGLVRSILSSCSAADQVDVVRDVALPIQSRALTYLLGVPESEAETWIGWGTHVFRDGGDSAEKGAGLEGYLRAAIEAAKADVDVENFFVALHAMAYEGRPLTEAEKLGMANLVFAGGRDTVINSISFLMAYFAEHPDALARTAGSQMSINLAVEETIRVVSPLTHIGRVCKHAVELGGTQVPYGQRVSLCWAAANYDPAIFSNPEQVNLARSPNPHVGFGSGVHNCLGAGQARAILRSLIRVLADLKIDISVRDMVPVRERFGEIERQVGYERLLVRLLRAP
ncbi:MAG: cytochrome P450 [Hyphomonadaceae bacterium]|nr:cytochrome P450 [Hyphomonadaceae bacterium]